ncbi:unnamed protein product, partial [Mesorhabditis spiculigera]
MPDQRLLSLVQWCGQVTDGRCGYCQPKRETSNGSDDSSTSGDERQGKSCSFGLFLLKANPDDEQFLLDCGWDRSGTYLYKPTMDTTCCPQYTIRLDVTKFRPSRTQKRVLRAAVDFLKNDNKPKRFVKEEGGQARCAASSASDEPSAKRPPAAVKERTVSAEGPRKKKLIRRERAIKRWQEKGLDVAAEQEKRRQKEKSREKTLADLLPEWDESWKHRLEVETVLVGSEEYRAREHEAYQVYLKYQTTIHNDKRASKSGFDNFLGSTPLRKELRNGITYGSFHQRYILDGKIVAVGAIDILPWCFSSKYLFYDPDFKFLTIGTYTALREIDYIQRTLRTKSAELKYYYMGYYIYTCPKMRYKAKFQPSELLCDESFTWKPVSECEKLLAENEGRFTTWAGNAPPATGLNPDEVPVYSSNMAYVWRVLRAQKPEFDTPEVNEKVAKWAKLAGPLADNICLYLNELNNRARQEPVEAESEEDDEEEEEEEA